MSRDKDRSPGWLERALHVDREHMSKADRDSFTDRLYDESLQPGTGDPRDASGGQDRK